MLILHDSAISRSKILTPVPKKEWMSSSISRPRDQFGNETVKTKWVIHAISNDGRAIWSGWFEDREEFDAFLLAVFKGTLKSERALWDLPTPNWQPYLGDIITYQFQTFVFLTGAGTVNTFNVPSDYRSIRSRVHCVGGGGGANSGFWFWTTNPGNTSLPPYYSNAYSCAGGSGGGYANRANVSLTPGGTCQYSVSTAGVGAVSPSSNTWFNGFSGANACVAGSGAAGVYIGNNSDYANATYNTPPATTISGGSLQAPVERRSVGDVSNPGGFGGSRKPKQIINPFCTISGAGGGGSGGPNGPGGAGAAGFPWDGNTTKLIGGGGGGAPNGGYDAPSIGQYGPGRGGDGNRNTSGSIYGGGGQWAFGKAIVGYSSYGNASYDLSGGGGGFSSTTNFYHTMPDNVTKRGARGEDGSPIFRIPINDANGNFLYWEYSWNLFYLNYWGERYWAGPGNENYTLGAGGGGAGGWPAPDYISFQITGGSAGGYGGGGGAGGYFYGSITNNDADPSSFRLVRGDDSSGGQGFIAVEYTPALSAGFNSPMLGM